MRHVCGWARVNTDSLLLKYYAGGRESGSRLRGGQLVVQPDHQMLGYFQAVSRGEISAYWLPGGQLLLTSFGQISKCPGMCAVEQGPTSKHQRFSRYGWNEAARCLQLLQPFFNDKNAVKSIFYWS